MHEEIQPAVYILAGRRNGTLYIGMASNESNIFEVLAARLAKPHPFPNGQWDRRPGSVKASPAISLPGTDPGSKRFGAKDMLQHNDFRPRGTSASSRANTRSNCATTNGMWEDGAQLY